MGTAAPARSWLLVAAPGPWPRRAFEDSPLGPEAGQAIVARARSQGTRPLFIRRHGRQPTDRRFAFVDAASGMVSWRPYRDLAEIAAAAWTAEDPLTDPLFLVCTHGRHDRCCAIAGRPVAGELHRLAPERTWECSHLGGDRFAANVVVLPTGATYGYVDALDTAGIVTASDTGRLFLPLLRGCSTDAPVVQAARVAAQRALARPGVFALREVSTEAVGTDRWVVHLADPDAAAVVSVERRRLPDARATCAARGPVSMYDWHVLDIAVR